MCPRCGSGRVAKRGRFFKSLECRLEAHRDVVKVTNMANLYSGGTAIGVVDTPSF